MTAPKGDWETLREFVACVTSDNMPPEWLPEVWRPLFDSLQYSVRHMGDPVLVRRALLVVAWSVSQGRRAFDLERMGIYGNTEVQEEIAQSVTSADAQLC
jgi:hypothetical protein